MEKRRNCSSSWAISHLFHIIFNMSLSSGVKVHIHFWNAFVRFIFSSIRKFDMSRYGYFEVLQRVPWTSRWEPTVIVIPVFVQEPFIRSQIIAYALQCQKTYLRTYAPSDDSNQPANPRGLIRLFVARIRKFASLAIQNAPSVDSDQIAWMRKLIWILARCACPKIGFRTLRFVWLESY